MVLHASQQNQLIQLRHQLHQNPELSGEESNTATLIASFLKTCQPDQLIENVGGHGIVATWVGEEAGEALLFRAELDALPIQETNDLAHASTVQGIAHKCGHDGHMAILCGLALKLAERKPSKGKVTLLFQPAEETGQGAKAVLSDPKFKRVSFDYAFALHNLPQRKKGAIFCKKGAFCAASTGLKIALQGKTAHASEPEAGNNPAMATAQLTFCFNKILETVDFINKTLITLTHVTIGEQSFGVAAGHSETWVTLRALEQHDFDLLLFLVQKEARQIAKKFGLGIKFSFHESFEVTENDTSSVELIKTSAKENNLIYKTLRKPNPWSEDFGLFLKEAKGAMFGIGAGKKTPALHNPDYDFPDDIIEPGVKVLWGIIQELGS